MAIFKQSNGKWRVQVDAGRKLDGSRDRRTRVVATKREAVAIERELLAMSGTGLSGRTRLADFVRTVWLPEKESICTWDTFRAYRSHLANHVLPALGDMEVAEIRHVHVQQMITACPTAKTARNARSTLANVLQMCVESDMVARNAARGKFRYPEAVPKPDPHGEWLTEFSEHRRMIEAARGTGVFPIMVLGLCFGLRKGEILALDWGDVDFRAGVVHIRKTYVATEGGNEIKAPKTPKSVRDVPMTSYARALLTELRDEGGITRAVGPVCEWRGRRLSPKTAASRVAAFRRAHPELPAITILSMRHSFATACIRAGINVASVSKWLGHNDITTTLNRYVLPLQQDLRADVADRIDALYGAAAV